MEWLNNMETTPRNILIRSIGILFFIFILFFGYNRFGRYLNGPIIQELSLEQYQTTTERSKIIEGVVENTQSLVINNKEITLNENGSFRYVMALAPGLSSVHIDITDAFGDSKHYQYHIYSTAEKFNYTKEHIETNITQEDIINE